MDYIFHLLVYFVILYIVNYLFFNLNFPDGAITEKYLLTEECKADNSDYKAPKCPARIKTVFSNIQRMQNCDVTKLSEGQNYKYIPMDDVADNFHLVEYALPGSESLGTIEASSLYEKLAKGLNTSKQENSLESEFLRSPFTQRIIHFEASRIRNSAAFFLNCLNNNGSSNYHFYVLVPKSVSMNLITLDDSNNKHHGSSL